MPKRLLVADDSVTIQKVISITFANEDFVVETVDNGAAALASVATNPPDVVLADAVMPDKSGYEVCQAIKSNPGTAHIPVLLLSGTFEHFDEARAAQCGADGHVAKPFESQALIDRVKTLVGQKLNPAIQPIPGMVRPQQQPQRPAAGRPPQPQGVGGPPPQQRPMGGPPPQQPQGMGGPPQQQRPMGGLPPQPQGVGGFPPQQRPMGGLPPQPQSMGGFPPQQRPMGGLPPQPQGKPPQQQRPMGGQPPQQRPAAGQPPQAPNLGGFPPQTPAMGGFPQPPRGLPPQPSAAPHAAQQYAPPASPPQARGPAAPQRGAPLPPPLGHPPMAQRQPAMFGDLGMEPPTSAARKPQPPPTSIRAQETPAFGGLGGGHAPYLAEPETDFDDEEESVSFDASVAPQAPDAHRPGPAFDRGWSMDDFERPPAAAPKPAAAGGVDPELVRQLVREMVEKVVWEVVPELAETIIREELHKLWKSRNS